MMDLFIFFLGAIFSIVLIPVIEKKKANFLQKESVNELMIEIEDIQSELNSHITQYFQFLLSIRTESELAQHGKLAVPIHGEIETSALIDLYKKTSTHLNSQQRLVIKKIPQSIRQIMQHAQIATDSVLSTQSYCIQSIKNTIKLSCHLAYELNSILQERERYKGLRNINSNTATIHVLKSLGFTTHQLADTRINESQFS